VESGIICSMRKPYSTPRHKATEAEQLEIVERFKQGTGVAELCIEYHHSHRTIKNFIEAAGLEVKYRRNVSRINSPIELKLQNALRAYGIGFATQCRYVGRYFVDIKLHQAPVIIEADGIQHTWGDAPERDAERDAAHEAAGFRVFRFTGSEINTNAMMCIQHVIDECDLTPDEDPVYDVKVVIAGEDHPSWKGGVLTFTCIRCGNEYRAYKKRLYCTQDCWATALREGSTPPKKARKPMSEEQKQRISSTLKGRKLTDQHRANISNGQKGRPLSSEHIARISASNRGKKRSAEIREKIGAASRGRTHTNESRAQISESLKRFYEVEENRKPCSPETRARISASQKRRFQTKIKSDLTGDSESSAEMTEPGSK
jgi:very-short-patch-repair endonuclease